MKYDPVAIGRRLRQLRQQHNLTAEEVAGRFSLSRAWWYGLETGRGSVSFEQAVRIADMFKVEIVSLLKVQK